MQSKSTQLVLFAVVVALWIAFAGALIFSSSSIHELWAWFTDQSLVLQIPLGILFFPWLVGMWIWEASWPAVARSVVVTGVGWATVYAFAPWKPFG